MLTRRGLLAASIAAPLAAAVGIPSSPVKIIPLGPAQLLSIPPGYRNWTANEGGDYELSESQDLPRPIRRAVIEISTNGGTDV